MHIDLYVHPSFRGLRPGNEHSSPRPRHAHLGLVHVLRGVSSLYPTRKRGFEGSARQHASARGAEATWPSFTSSRSG